MKAKNSQLEIIIIQFLFQFIAVCNNVGEAVFLGPNQKIENPLPRAL